MDDEEKQCQAFEENSTQPIDDWSRCIFSACRSWPLATANRWLRAEEGWLRLRIEIVNGNRLEPVSVVELDTAEEQISIDFGCWGTPISRRSEAIQIAAHRAVCSARELIEDWVGEKIRIASYSDDKGYLGSEFIHGGTLPEAIDPAPFDPGKGGRVLIKSLHRDDWQWWDRTRDGRWVQWAPT